MELESNIPLIRKLWFHLPRTRKGQIFLLIGLTVLSSLAEMVSVAAVIPFLSLVAGSQSPLTQFLKDFFANSFDFAPDNWITIITLFFIATVVIAAVIKIVMQTFLTYLAARIGVDFGYKLFRVNLNQSFLNASKAHSGDALAVLNKALLLVEQFIRPVFVMLSSIFLMTAIVITVLFLEPLISLSMFIGFGIVYFFIAFTLRSRIRSHSLLYAESHEKMVRTIQDGLGANREIIMNQYEAVYSNKLMSILSPMQDSFALIKILGGIPRHFIEAFGIILICVLVLFFERNGEGFVEVIPVLGLFALAMHRSLPLMQQTYSSYTSIQGSFGMLRDVAYSLDKKQVIEVGGTQFPFAHKICLKNITFTYPGADLPVLSGVSFTIKKGTIVGISGPTGSGKTSLLDLLAGLLEPCSGRISVDNFLLSDLYKSSWMSKIAYVAQSTYLLDKSMIENICFGVELKDIDYDRLQRAVFLSDLTEFIAEQKDGINCLLGERGSKLSGGQRQKIGIARALYKWPEILILDEATSALDKDTEKRVMKGIIEQKSDMTVVLVSHAPTTFKYCDEVFSLKSSASKI